jgi:hypothetical protein
MRRNKGLLVLALLALLTMMISVTVGATASASGGNAVAAKKKCKKKNHAASAKKKKCKKKKASTTVVRATLTWSNGGSSDVDMDLFAFDANGNRAGNGSDTIPMSTLSPDVTGPQGTETFTDQAFNLKRPLSFGVCYIVGGSVHTDYTITYVTADGATHTDTKAGDNSLGSSDQVPYPADGVVVPANFCGFA